MDLFLAAAAAIDGEERLEDDDDSVVGVFASDEVGVEEEAEVDADDLSPFCFCWWL